MIVQHSAGQPITWLEQGFKEAYECHLVALLGVLYERHRGGEHGHVHPLYAPYRAISVRNFGHASRVAALMGTNWRQI